MRQNKDHGCTDIKVESVRPKTYIIDPAAMITLPRNCNNKRRIHFGCLHLWKILSKFKKVTIEQALNVQGGIEVVLYSFLNLGPR